VLHASTKKRRTPGGKFNALFRRHTTGKGSASSNGSGSAHKSYMRSAGGEVLFSGSKGVGPYLAHVSIDSSGHFSL
jgi:hypothetical protein